MHNSSLDAVIPWKMWAFSSLATAFRAVVVLAVVSLLAAPARAAVDDDYKDGVGHYNKSRWKLASESFKKFIAANPKHRSAENAQFYLGLALINLDDHKQAREVLRTFTNLYPRGNNAVQALYWTGQSSYFLDDFPAAVAELTAFVNQSKDDPLLERALPYLGESEARLKHYDLAAKWFDQARTKFPQGVVIEETEYGLARAYDELGRLPEAKTIYQKLASNRTGERAPDAQMRLAAILFDEKDYAKAAEAYQVVEDKFPESTQVPLARLNRGFSLYQSADFAEAAKAFETAAATAKNAPDARYWQGLSLRSLDKNAEAIDVFLGAYDKFQAEPGSERYLLQVAHCELRRSAFDKARERYMQLVDNYPKSPVADEALHSACQAGLLGGRFAETEALLSRFDQQFPNNRLRLWQEILKGRLLLATAADGTAGDGKRAAAVQVFEAVTSASTLLPVKLHAQYYMAIALQSQRNFTKLLEVTTGVAEAVVKDREMRELTGVFVLRAAARLTIGKALPIDMLEPKRQQFEAAAEEAEKYLALENQGPLADQALSLKCVAQAHAGNTDGAESTLAALKSRFPGSQRLDETLFELGDVAHSRGDFAQANALYGDIVARPESLLFSKALFELGWSQYRGQRYPEAATSFSRFVTAFGRDKNAAEAAFMQGQSLQDSGKIAEAQRAFEYTFETFGQSEYAFRAGQQSGKLLADLARSDEGLDPKQMVNVDRVFAKLIERFPKHNDAAKILDRWAMLNVEAERFEQADATFLKLVTDYPTSPLAYNARLSLAESDLVSNQPGKLGSARAAFVVLSMEPKAEAAVQQKALFQLMQIEMETKRWEDLRKVCRHYLERFPQGEFHWDADFHAAEADFERGMLPEALVRLENLRQGRTTPLKADGTPADTGTGGTTPPAADAEAIKRTKWYPRLWRMLAETQFRQKNYKAVEATVTEFRNANPDSPFLYFLDDTLGRSYKSQAMWAEARTAFERVIADSHGRLTETAAKCHFLLAETYFFEKDYKHALDEFLKVEIRYKYPDFQGLALFQAAACYEKTDEWKDAVKTYEDLLRDFPNHEKAAEARERLEAARKRV